MPLADPRNIGREQAYAQSPSGPRGASMQPQQAPTGWLSQLQNMLQSATAAGIDPARLGLQGMFGQQQPRTIRTTDPGAGYGMSPSGPTTQQPARQPTRDLQPHRGAHYTAPYIPENPPLEPGFRNIDLTRISPSYPWAQQPARQPQMRRPQQNVTEQFSVPARYGQSPSNPNWQPRRPMSPLYEGPPPPPRPPVTARPPSIPPPPRTMPRPPGMGP